MYQQQGFDFDSTGNMMKGSVNRVVVMVEAGRGNRKLMLYMVIILAVSFYVLFKLFSRVHSWVSAPLLRNTGLSSIVFLFPVAIWHYDRGYFFYNQCSIYFFFITKLYFLINILLFNKLNWHVSYLFKKDPKKQKIRS